MPTGRPESTRNTAIRRLRKAQQAIHVEEPAKRPINSTQQPTGWWFGKIPQLVFGVLALARRANGIIVITTPTMPQESTETQTSSAQNPDTATSTQST